MLVSPSRKIKNGWDEEYIVAKIVANMNIAARWFSSIMPNHYFESGLYSGLMITTSVPSIGIDPNIYFPGDIDILAIPYDEDDLVLSETVAIEIKVLRGEKRRPGKSPNKFGYSQARALLNHGFPYVAVGHVVVTDDPLDDLDGGMLAASMGEDGVITKVDVCKVDMFENSLAKREFGRLACNRPNEQIGFFVMNYDGARLFEPMGRSCIRNPKYSEKLLDRIYYYYKENYELFLKIPRYSESEIILWERRIEENPKAKTPWDTYRKFFRDRQIQELRTLLVDIDGEKRIGYFCHTDNVDFLLCDMN